jgi:hypothetical protein
MLLHNADEVKAAGMEGGFNLQAAVRIAHLRAIPAAGAMSLVPHNALIGDHGVGTALEATQRLGWT